MKTKKVEKSIHFFRENTIQKGTEKVIGGNATSTTDDFVTEDHVMLKQPEVNHVIIEDHFL